MTFDTTIVLKFRTADDVLPYSYGLVSNKANAMAEREVYGWFECPADARSWATELGLTCDTAYHVRYDEFDGFRECYVCGVDTRYVSPHSGRPCCGGCL